jgi:hypothetical protein
MRRLVQVGLLVPRGNGDGVSYWLMLPGSSD